MARALAAEVISERPFEPVSDEAYERALCVLMGCEQVICCLSQFGSMNEKNRELAAFAKKNKK